MSKMLPTIIAREWFLTRVNSLMWYKMTLVIERFSTFVTCEWFFTSMNSLVNNKTTLLSERFSALLTYERFFTCVNSQMFRKITLMIKRFPALITNELFGIRVTTTCLKITLVMRWVGVSRIGWIFHVGSYVLSKAMNNHSLSLRTDHWISLHILLSIIIKKILLVHVITMENMI